MSSLRSGSVRTHPLHESLLDDAMDDEAAMGGHLSPSGSLSALTGLSPSPPSALLVPSMVHVRSGTGTAAATFSGVNGLSASPPPPPNTATASPYRVYRRRWWVLFVFCLLAFGQSLIWITFSPITNAAKQYYNISEADVALLLNWGTIWYIVGAPFVVAWATTAEGLRKLLIASAWLEFAAVVLRMVPIVIAPHVLHAHSIVFLHVAQILNALACPPIGVTVTKLSCVWFGENERTRTTAIAMMANNVGTAAGMLLAPYVVTRADEIPRLLWAHAGFGVFALVCTLVYLPPCPPTHPSPAAAFMFARPPEPFFPAVVASLKHGHFVLLVVASGLSMGIFITWSGVLSTILPESEFSTQTVGWFSFSAITASIVSGIVHGSLAQHPAFRSRLKALIGSLMCGAAACAVWFSLSVPSVFSAHALIPAGGTRAIGAAVTLLGWFVGASYPLAFELAVELTYPIQESVSGGVLSTMSNIVGVIFLFVVPSLSGPVANAVLVCVLVAGAAVLMGVRETYRRQTQEALALKEAEVAASMAHDTLQPLVHPSAHINGDEHQHADEHGLDQNGSGLGPKASLAIDAALASHARTIRSLQTQIAHTPSSPADAVLHSRSLSRSSTFFPPLVL